jgi:hypothetical protein
VPLLLLLLLPTPLLLLLLVELADEGGDPTARSAA